MVAGKRRRQHHQHRVHSWAACRDCAAGLCRRQGGLIHLTKALALEWSRANIRVNAIAPGYILTEINQEWFATEGRARPAIKRIPQRRIGSPARIWMGLCCCWPPMTSSYMTGSIIVADGGHAVNSL